MEQTDLKNRPESSLDILRRAVKTGGIRQALKDWSWAFSYTFRFRGKIILNTAMALFGNLLGLGSGIVSKYLIDRIIERNVAYFWSLAALMLILLGVSLAVSTISAKISARLELDVVNAIRTDAFETLLHSRWQSLNRYSSGDLVQRMGADVSAVANIAVRWLPNLVIYLLSFLATLLVILHFDPWMALIALVTTPVLLLVSRPLMRKLRFFSEKMKVAGSRFSSFQVDTFYNLDVIKSFGAEDKTVQKLDKVQHDFRRVALRQSDFSIHTHVILSILGKFTELLALGYCLWRLWAGGMSFGTMTFFLEQRSRLSNSFSSLAGLLPSAVTGAVSTQRVRELMQLPKEPPLPASISDAPVGGLRVHIRDVDVSYEDEDSPVLQDADLQAHPGELVALVGRSGEGKTTLLRLILGLLEPEKGEAAILRPDGSVLAQASEARRYISYVPQGNSMLAGTIADNLRLVRSDASDEELVAALKTACAWSFVSKLPKGIYSEVGERGKGFSEGQAQRIAIARAIVYDAPILLLDEATSALDPETERELLQNLVKQCPHKTVILTTHRLSVLDQCHRIYRIENGRLTEQT